MEHGFYHPTIGYWQTNSDVPNHVLAGYPFGTVEIGVKPGSNYEWLNNAWVYVAPPPPSDEELIAEISAKRSRLFLDSDWTQLADISAATKALWEPYRQALRDITDQPDYPRNVIWPTPPQ